MRRIMFSISLLMMLFIICYYGNPWMMLCIVVLMCMLIATAIMKQRMPRMFHMVYRSEIYLIILCMIASMCLYELRVYEYYQISSRCGLAHLNGVIVSDNKNMVELSDVRINGHKIRRHIMIKLKSTQLKSTQYTMSQGDYVDVYGSLTMFRPATNPNGFDERLYYASRNIDGYMTDVTLLKRDDTKKSRLLKVKYAIREYFKNTMYRFMNEPEANLSMGILLGDKSYIGYQVKDYFVKSGTAHILVVSGLHFGILYLILCKLLSKLKINYHLSQVVILLIMFVFLLIVGSGFSALRAFSMMLLHSLSVVLKRRYDLLNSLGIALFFSIVHNPLCVFSVGLQMSLIAVITIGFYNIYKVKTNSVIYDMFGLVSILQLSFFLLMTYHFNEYYPYGIIFNIPVIILMPFVMMSLILFISFAPMYALGRLFGFITGAFLTSLMELVSYIEQFPVHKIVMRSFPAAVVVFVYVVIIVMLLYPSRIKNIFYTMMLVVAVMLIISFHDGVEARVDFLDVGQGDGTLITTNKKHHILIDGGKQGKEFHKLLLRQGIHCIDAAFISHFDEDHYGGILDLSPSVNIKHIYYGFQPDKKSVLEHLKSLFPNTEFTKLSAGDNLHMDNTQIQILSPFENGLNVSSNKNELQFDDELSTNNCSLVFMMKVDNATILMTGDIHASAEHMLTSRYKFCDIDILKVPHHGSASSSTQEFIDAVHPKSAVIQVGKNSYGHPRDNIIRRYQKKKIDIFRNDEHGCVRYEISKNHQPSWYVFTEEKIPSIIFR